MFGCHHQFNGHRFGWTPGVGDGQGGLACCGSWGCKVLDRTERLKFKHIWAAKYIKDASDDLPNKANNPLLMWMSTGSLFSWSFCYCLRTNVHEYYIMLYY